ncbi:MAG: protein kinase [Sandaracinaceae bacterium]|nr:protein kinase [Sandaracinaceae bacterium]
MPHDPPRVAAIPDELLATVEAVLDRLGVDAKTIEARPSSTIVPEPRTGDTAGERAIGLLADLNAASTISQKVELGGTIGEGGMGVVRLGFQRTLARAVAVKTLKDDAKSERATIKLLREAWVTGNLEHPNVVPVYDLALESDGSPLIVLKKIEGTGWDELIADADAVRARFKADDLLEWNLRILLSVSNAVHFAHSRGILHRDLKPENVMIGEFGEVYLVDWGIAVSLRDDESGRLPLAKDALEMAGTPLYMAPEMLGGPTSKLSERTDVYLLGAILYEIVTGRPPHAGEGLMQLVAQIVDSSPPLADDVPEELRRVIRRAMDPDPDGRFESAAQLRLALQGFLQHRDAMALADKADARLAELEARLASASEDDALEAREPVYRLFGECRFAYKHALEVWPEGEAARRGLARAIEAMVEYELSLGEPEAARTLLAELDPVPEALAARVEEARAARRAEEAELRRIQEDADPSAGRRTRAFLGVLIGTVWSLMPLVPELARLFGYDLERSHVVPLISEAVILAFIVGLGIWARESLSRTRVNRTLATAVVLAMGSSLLMHAVEHLTGSDATVGATFRHQVLVWGALCMLCAPAIDWRLAIPGAAFAVAFVVLSIWPSVVYYALAVCNEILLVTIAVLWLRREDIASLREGRRRRMAERRAWLRERLRGRRAEA